ncbi:MAG TPA: flagellar basal body rod protein FlgB [Sedimentisphaerales bacterium]|nr:flagellar basal body rod protein FlgB [Sedimentisphaerales bacterium]
MTKVTNITDFLETGIKAAGLRHNAIANNIANLETADYRRLDIRFEQLLQKALDSAGPVRPDQIQPEIHQPKQTPVKSNGNDVNLEGEIGQMLKNILRYKTYVRLLNKKYDQIERAMKVQ